MTITEKDGKIDSIMFPRKQEGIGAKAELEGGLALGRGHSSSIITGDKEGQMGPGLGR